jgi:hypothetical protein
LLTDVRPLSLKGSLSFSSFQAWPPPPLSPPERTRALLLEALGLTLLACLLLFPPTQMPELTLFGISIDKIEGVRAQAGISCQDWLSLDAPVLSPWYLGYPRKCLLDVGAGILPPQGWKSVSHESPSLFTYAWAYVQEDTSSGEPVVQQLSLSWSTRQPEALAPQLDSSTLLSQGLEDFLAP